MAVSADLQSQGKRARVVSGADGIVATIAPELRSGDVVAILSNGGFDGIYEKLPGRLRAMADDSKSGAPEAAAKA
jgi:UDP-N-acetylmuramate: L-alanyl-gamma-D-glutamyl-meso-diaminopimelate ligase